LTDPAGGQTAFADDANSNLLTVTDALSHTTTYAYNNMDRVITRTDPLSRGESLEDGYELNLTRGFVGAPDLKYPAEFWRGLGIRKTNVRRDGS
jgi:YD repeat-containing protein